MRKLASVQKIVSVTEIKDPKTGEPATSIEAVGVLGWECVAKKGEFKVGDLAVYFEIDSTLPEKILRAANLWKEEENKGMLNKGGSVLTTRRMLGVLSQGLVLPFSVFRQIGYVTSGWREDTDLTEHLNVVKYEEQVEEEYNGGPLSFKKKVIKRIRGLIYRAIHKYPSLEPRVTNLARKYKWFRNILSNSQDSFPSFIAKTDQSRVQNLTRNFDEMINDIFEETEKMEGTSSTYFYFNGDYGMCSRNLRLSNYDTTHFGKVENKMSLFAKLKEYKKNIAIQGEICGPGIQGNYYNLPDFKLFIFDVFLIDERRKALPGERQDILKDLGLQEDQAPMIGKKYINLVGMTTSSILERVTCKSVINSDKGAEGRVYKSTTKPNVHFKAINNNYLLKKK